MEILDLHTVQQQQVIEKALLVLRRGGLLVYPTETVYGLGVDATNQEAVDKLLKFKGQRGLKPILVAVSDQKMAEEYVELNRVARNLYRTFLPGPVAVVSRLKRPGLFEKGRAFKRFKRFARGISSPEGTVGIRIPDYPLILNIIKAFGKPITSTSANISGARNPWSLHDVKETTPDQKLALVDLALDAEQLPKRPPSTIVDTSKEQTEIVREGEVRIGKKVKGKGTKVKKYISHSPQETMDIAGSLVHNFFLPSSLYPLPSAFVLALQGPLGAGKTVFAKGIARALGVVGPIRSPSYTLVREYPITGGIFFHIDAWRLADISESQDLGLDTMLKQACPPAFEFSSLRRGNIIVIEWIERLALLLKKIQEKAKIIVVDIEVVDARKREITVYS